MDAGESNRISFITDEWKRFLLVSNNSEVDGGVSVLLDGGQQRGPVGISNLSWVKVVLRVQQLHRRKTVAALKKHAGVLDGTTHKKTLALVPPEAQQQRQCLGTG